MGMIRWPRVRSCLADASLKTPPRDGNPTPSGDRFGRKPRGPRLGAGVSAALTAVRNKGRETGSSHASLGARYREGLDPSGYRPEPRSALDRPPRPRACSLRSQSPGRGGEH